MANNGACFWKCVYRAYHAASHTFSHILPLSCFAACCMRNIIEKKVCTYIMRHVMSARRKASKWRRKEAGIRRAKYSRSALALELASMKYARACGIAAIRTKNIAESTGRGNYTGGIFPALKRDANMPFKAASEMARNQRIFMPLMARCILRYAESGAAAANGIGHGRIWRV